MEYLYLKWINYKTGKKYLLGALFRDKEKGKYYFKMSKKHVEKALEEKAISRSILPFSDFDKIYESDEIFPIFKIRLPKIERYTDDEIKELQMDEYDEFEYLRKTKGVLVTDKFIIEEEK